MSDEILTPEPGTEPTVEVTPNEVDPEIETPQTPVEPENPQPGEPETPPPPQEPDWKKKATEQGKENILINARLEQEKTRIAQLTSKDAPTDDEMRGLYPEWDQLDDYNKRVLTNTRQTEKRAIAAEQRAAAIEEKRQFEDSLDDFTESPPDEFKGLQGKEAEFKRFARRKDNVGLPLKILAQAFLFEATVDAEPVPQPPPNKGPGLEDGSGGPRTAPTQKKISLEEAAKIRKADYRRWKELLDAGMIEEFEG